ncbi:MAG: hypothetical protein HY853_00050 [Burkholderiales bacterium]|nr:hypothetical protein [Burkholderiales bacterium]
MTAQKRYLLLGIEDQPLRKVVGTAAFDDPVEMAARMFQALGFRVEIEEVLHPDGRVLVFHIPGRSRGTVYDFEGAYLMRAGEELVPMSEDRLRAIFAEGQPDWFSQPALVGCDPVCQEAGSIRPVGAEGRAGHRLRGQKQAEDEAG